MKYFNLKKKRKNNLKKIKSKTFKILVINLTQKTNKTIKI